MGLFYRWWVSSWVRATLIHLRRDGPSEKADGSLLVAEDRKVGAAGNVEIYAFSQWPMTNHDHHSCDDHGDDIACKVYGNVFDWQAVRKHDWDIQQTTRADVFVKGFGTWRRQQS